MKRTLVLIAVIVLAAGMVYADSHLSFGTPEGQWNLVGGRLFQQDEGAPRAKAWMAIPQNGSMIYEFTMRYEGGGEDGHGGVGIQFLADSVPTGKSWGFGDSWLLWLNYDENPTAAGVPRGLVSILPGGAGLHPDRTWRDLGGRRAVGAAFRC